MLLCEYDSISEASKKTKIAESTIRDSIKRELPYIVDVRAKFIWREKSNDARDRIDVVIKPRYNYIHKTDRRVMQCSQDGCLIRVWKNILEATEQTGEPYALIRKQCLGIPTKKKTPSVWKYYKNESLAV